jgi:aspartate aminotransferase
MKLSTRIGRVGASPTLAISAKAQALRREGKDIIGFGAGEPDFDTPEDIKAAARRAMRDGRTKYSPEAGELELREGLVRLYREKHGLHYTTEQIFVSNGAKHTLYNLFAAVLDPGDEVLIVAPFWVSYPAQVLLADGKPVIVESTAEHNFCPTREALDAALTSRTRILVLNSPGNPTGAVWRREQLEMLARWLRAHPDLLCIYDGIYSELTYGDATYHELASLDSDIKEQVACVNGVSKSFAMTGWRIGWAAGPHAWIKAATTFQSQTTSGPNTIAQWATLAALSIDAEVVEQMRKSYDGRRLLTCHLLEDIPHIRLVRPGGAFYAFPDLNAFIGGHSPLGVLADDIALSAYLLEAVGVAVVPGSAFGAPGFLRLTYACDENSIQHGISRIAEALDRVIPAGH